MPGGHIQSGEECYPFRHAVCTEDDPGAVLSIEAEGEQALFQLPTRSAPRTTTAALARSGGCPNLPRPAPQEGC